MDVKLNSEKIDPEKDLMPVMDEIYYTFTGAMKMTGLKESSLRNEMKEKRIRVFKHPVRDLFSKAAIEEWTINRTVRPDYKKK